MTRKLLFFVSVAILGLVSMSLFSRSRQSSDSVPVATDTHTPVLQVTEGSQPSTQSSVKEYSYSDHHLVADGRIVRFSVVDSYDFPLDKCVARFLTPSSGMAFTFRSSNGIFWVFSEGEEASVEISHFGFETQTFRIPRGEDDVDLGFIKLFEAQQLAVSVFDENSLPVSGASIFVTLASRPNDLRPTEKLVGETDSSGRLSIPVGGGSYFLRAEKESAQSVRSPVTSLDDALLLTLKAQPNVVCHFLQENGDPISGLQLALFPVRTSQKGDRELATLTTNGSGAVSFYARTGSYHFRIVDASWRRFEARSTAIRLTVHDGTTNETFTMVPQQTLELSVVDARTGDPIEEYAVGIHTFLPGNSPPYADPAVAALYKDGRTSVRSPDTDGEYWISVKADGFVEQTIETALRSGRVDFRLEGSDPIIIRLVDEQSRSLPDHFVRLRQNYHRDPFDLARGRITSSGQTNSSGEWRSLDWVPGVAAVDVSSDGNLYQHCGMVNLPSNDLTITVPAPGTVVAQLGRDLTPIEIPDIVLKQGSGTRSTFAWPQVSGRQFLFHSVPPGT